MKILIFGATGMVGQGALRECLEAVDVSEVRVVVRTPLTQAHPKLHQIIHRDFFDFSPVESQLQGFDACFYCIGMPSAGMDEAAYTRCTHDMTMAAASVLARLNPQMTFVYVSGAGADSSERGKVMWARVRGRLENALQRLPFKATYCLRPGIIQPLHGIQSKTGAYRWMYTLTTPLLPLARRLFPNHVLSTEIIGQAMLSLARWGADRAVLETGDIRAVSVRG